MKSTMLVCYDIADSKRLQKVYKLMRGYGEHMQYSVFLCDLKPKQWLELRNSLQEIIDPEADQILFIPTAQREKFEAMGKDLPERERLVYIIG